MRYIALAAIPLAGIALIVWQVLATVTQVAP